MDNPPPPPPLPSLGRLGMQTHLSMHATVQRQGLADGNFHYVQESRSIVTRHVSPCPLASTLISSRRCVVRHEHGLMEF